MMRFLAIGALLTAPAAALAAGPDDGDDRKDKMVCKTQGETGSRLGKKRICMTAAQWDEQRRLVQQNVDKAQTTQVNKSGS